MSRPLRVLLVEDSEDDALLLVRELQRGGYDVMFERVDTPAAMKAALDKEEWDLVFSDFSMPHFSGIDALALANEKDLDVPFIFVSGSMGEETAVATLKAGAHDYLMKGHLKRLLPAVERELHEAERRKEHKLVERQLRQAEKLETIGQLTGGIAHDFNNLLNIILGFGELALSRLEESDPVRRHVEQMRKAAEHATSLTRRLLAFSRRQVLQPKILDLNAVVADLERMLQRLVREDIEFRTVLDPGLGRVNADPGQIEQVIMNLVVNAGDAMPEGGKLTISTTNVELDGRYARLHGGVVRPGPYVMLAVSDSGTGITAEVQNQIFEPFFTTKEPGKGTGMGLATVYGIVKQSGGYIWVYSELGKGTTFKIYLPTVTEKAEATREPRITPLTANGTETVLLVEDAEALRELAREFLESSGYTVLEAGNGAEALKIAEEHPGAIDILVTDVILPGMSGPELAKNLKAQRPAVKVIYASGYTADAITHHGVLEPGTVLVEKPYTKDKLTRTVREAMDN